MFGWKRFQIGTVFGIPLRIDPTWFIIVALLSWTLAVGYYPTQYKGLSIGAYWGLGIASAILLFVAVLLHELGHAIIARRNGIPVQGITLFIFGGVSELTDEPPSAGAEARVTLAGWLVSAVICVICYGIYLAIPGGGTASVVARALFSYLALVNGLLFVFNGIPGFPLDGGRLLRAIVWSITGSLRRATYIASTVGSVFGLVLIIYGVLAILGGGNPVGGIWFALIGFFLRSAAHGSYQQLMLRRALEGVPASQLMTRAVVTVSPSTTLAELVKEYFMKHHFHSFPVLDNGELRGLVNLRDVKGVSEDEWPSRTVGDAIVGHGDAPAAITPETDTMEVLAAMMRTGLGRLPVVTDDGHFVGIISRRDITHFLAIKTDLAPERS